MQHRCVHRRSCVKELWQREERAQGTLEYAAVFLGFIAMVVALSLLWHAGHDGLLGAAAERAASHVLSTTGALDIALF